MLAEMEFRIIAYVIFLCKLSADSTRMVFKENGYEGIIIAINPQIGEDPELIHALKTLWTDASRYLFGATRNRAYFRNITILVPTTWTEGSYSKLSSSESYASSDVLVANPNPIFENSPYTLQYGECGKPGQYIHLTPNYIKQEKFVADTGVKGKVIVHEWAHLRWGVFDEAPTEGYPEFYLVEGYVEATRCSAALQGFNAEISSELRQMHQSCPLDESTLLPKPGCYFVPLAEQPPGLKSSLMSHQYLESVTSFCHSDPRDPLNRHNEAAPNEQNRLCNLRSVWDVILDSDDFVNGRNPSISGVFDTTPHFNIIQAAPSRHVLVMDVSGSMSGLRLLTMQRAASLFVSEYVPDGSFVGLVDFSTDSYILSQLKKLDDTSRGDLETIVKSLTTRENSTRIDSGILKGLEVLNRGGHGGGSLIVLTDGGQTESAYMTEVYDDVISSGAQMYTIFLDVNADNNVNKLITNLSQESGGEWFLTNSTALNSDMIDIFRLLSQENDGTNQVHSKSFVATSRQTKSQVEQIEVKPGLTLTDITSAMPTVIYVRVTQGFYPVLDVTVTAIVTTPSMNKVTSELFDNGAGSDVRKNDGIYSRYFFQYDSQGRYSVRIEVEKKLSAGRKATGGSAVYISPGSIINGTFVFNPGFKPKLPTSGTSRTSGPRLTSGSTITTTGYAFSYTGPTIVGDMFGPCKITDLSGRQLSVTNLGAEVLIYITFTAPGDDLDTGIASRYEIRYSFGTVSYFIANFKTSLEVKDEDVVEGNITSPLPSRSQEKIKFKMAIPPPTPSVVYVALRAHDEVGNPPDPSNLLPIGLTFDQSKLPPLPSPATTTVRPTTTTVRPTTTTVRPSTTTVRPTTTKVRPTTTKVRPTTTTVRPTTTTVRPTTTTVLSTKKMVTTTARQNKPAPTTQATASATSITQFDDDAVEVDPVPESSMPYKIAVGVFGGLALVLAVTITAMYSGTSRPADDFSV